MISIINLPAETPSEYFAAAPRSRSLGDVLFLHHEKLPVPTSFTPDGKPIGFPSEQGPNLLWQDALQRSVVYKLEEDGLQMRSKSCSNICSMCDQKISKEKCSENEKHSMFWKIHDEHSQHHCPLKTLIKKTNEVMNEAGNVLTRVERSIAKELFELGN